MAGFRPLRRSIRVSSSLLTATLGPAQVLQARELSRSPRGQTSSAQTGGSSDRPTATSCGSAFCQLLSAKSCPTRSVPIPTAPPTSTW
jgi:hypothetical protein